MSESHSYKDHTLHIISQPDPVENGKFLAVAIVRGKLAPVDSDVGVFYSPPKASVDEAKNKALEKAKAWLDEQISKGK
jgi:hypothetical protein